MQRDIKGLERAGFPIVSEARDGTIFWRFIEGFAAESPVSLTLTELMALYYSRGLLRPLQGSEIYDSLEGAMQKIGATLPAESLRLMRELEGAVAVSTSGWKDYSRSREVMDKLTKAGCTDIRSALNTRLSDTRIPFHEKSIPTNSGTSTTACIWWDWTIGAKI